MTGLRDVATDRTGSIVYWATQQRPKGSGDLGFNRILKWTQGAGFSVAVAARESLYWYSQPVVGPDGSLLGQREYFPCLSPSCGLSGYQPQTYSVRLPSGDAVAKDNSGLILRQSPDAKFLVMGDGRILEMESGRALQIALTTSAYVAAVSDNGLAVVIEDGGVARLWRNGQYLPFRMETSGIVSAALNSDGKWMAFAAFDSGNGRLRYSLINTEGDPSVRFLYEDPAEYPNPAGVAVTIAITPSGLHVVGLATQSSVRAGGSLTLVAATRVPQIQVLSSTAASFALSGDGRQVWFIAAEEGLTRWTIDASLPLEHVAPYRELNGYVGGVGGPISAAIGLAKGSFTRLVGAGLHTEGETQPEVNVEGQPAPLPFLGGSSRLIETQTPWEFIETAPNQPANIVVTWEDSPLELTAKAAVVKTLPAFESSEPPSSFPITRPQAKAIHEDWRGLVSALDPATAGEMVHFYLTGLGPVDQQVETGKPSPADPPAKLLIDPSCSIAGIETEVSYAGLAPGLIGIYQIDAKIPLQPSSGLQPVLCGGFGWIVIR